MSEKPKWTDLFGIDPNYTDGKPVDEWLDEHRGGDAYERGRRDGAAAVVARVEALVEEWEQCGELPEPRGRIYRTNAANLRDALASDDREPTP